MTEAMKITLSTQPADGRWGEKATWSINNDGIALHLNGKDDLGLIQRAARKIDGMGIKHVALSGEGWNTDRAWAFWAGYKGPKGQRQVEWPSLDDAQRSELDNRLTIIGLGARHHQCAGGRAGVRSSWRSALSTCCVAWRVRR
ncbi:Peptidase B [Serratia liquefaciens]|nr:Peptidase B [Serratia liquefaciens]